MSFRLREKSKSRVWAGTEGEERVWVRFNSPHGYVRFSLGALKTMGVEFGDRIEVLVGEGEDEGWLAFRREREGQGYVVSRNSTIDLFALLRQLKLREPLLLVTGEERDGMLVVDLREGVGES